jgi:hypothetical protein
VGVLNRRNALLGWTVWQFAKTMAKRKARQSVPKVDTERKRPNKTAVAAALLAVGATLMFWRKRSSGDDTPPDETPPV